MKTEVVTEEGYARLLGAFNQVAIQDEAMERISIIQDGGILRIITVDEAQHAPIRN